MSNTIIIVCFFTAIIHMSETLALSMRLAGVRTKQIATSISFVNVSFLISRMSNMLQAPLLGAMVDTAIHHGTAAELMLNFRFILLAAFAGNLLGALLTPTMVNIFIQGIFIFEKTGSIPRLIRRALRPRAILKMIKAFRLPRLSMLKDIRWHKIPHTFIYLNILMVGIYAVGVLSSLLAGAMLPDMRATAVQLSGIVNGLATIMLAIAVDPAGAHITDQAVRGKRPLGDVRTMVFFLVTGRLVATLILAQLFLAPATTYIMYVTQVIGKHFGG
jgi:hypothetical protein